MNKRGLIGQVTNSIVAGAIGLLVLAGVLVGVTAFRTSQVTNVANCGKNATGGAAAPLYTGCGSAYNLTTNVGIMSNKFGEQLSTVGTMFGVALILSAIGLLGFGVAMGARRLQ